MLVDEANGKLAAANKTVEDLKKLMPGVDLLSDPPVLMPVSEALADFGEACGFSNG